MKTFEASVAAALGSRPAGTVFLAAVSGGADSTAMLAALAALRDRAGAAGGAFELRCLHVEHGIRPAAESRGDAAAVKALCAELGVPCRVVSIRPGKIAETGKEKRIGIEAAARLYRHTAWNREAQRIGAAAVLVAHTRDDLLETTLMRFLRGSGPGGLAALRQSRGRILRPILGLGRAEVLAYLAKRGLPYRTDSTNADPVYLRNRIRLKLIPCLDEFFPFWRKAVLELGETQRLSADFLSAEAARIPWKTTAPETLTLPVEEFFSHSEIIREEALFAALDRMRSKDSPGGQPRRRSLRLFAQREVSSLDLGFASLADEGADITLRRKPRSYEKGFSLLIKEPGIYKLKELTIKILSGAELENPGSASNEDGKFPAVLPAKVPGFFTGLPLVFRRYYPGDSISRGGRHYRGADITDKAGRAALITAYDARGPVAFIGPGRAGPGIGVLLAREEMNQKDRDTSPFFSIIVGGIDVQ
ncbi:tRNA(Ile)-lysidine synthase [Treponema primitia ZAS-2]|uniref:tRNA(Ile)-lysidine synthase n=1 Tax=Treponema primitia (strain ATCC BAA-887 / DSM 12427 / ZAS-2) TaxID=545694 RepID=F5YGS7_TREPZ|nr:tRNA lysidine(34) synthetase TilS [Treponema primitia]AEF86650.1 tRNA(Ile)-lysidine synthase [Treponema primitia ZAS-2]